jgi:hypothetical protein
MYSLQSYRVHLLVNVPDCKNNARNEQYQIEVELLDSTLFTTAIQKFLITKTYHAVSSSAFPIKEESFLKS